MADAAPSVASSYDQVPYESFPYPQAHPDRLATVATLFGLDVPDVASCRMLELGCAAGGHLVPLGVAFPRASFVGVDLSSRQVDEGREIVETLGLANVDLRHLSITDVDASFGEFDFAVSHGVYSWVPPDVQDRLLGLLAERLRPGGLAYVSYNTYPGWHLRGMIRDMMQYHASRFREPGTRATQARALLDFLANSVRDPESPYGQLLKGELDLLRRLSDSYLLHEHLEEHNQALYFHQFVERATRHGLAYVGEAHVPGMAAYAFSDNVQATLRSISADRFQAEQYMDFLRNRSFRQTILTPAREGAAPRLRTDAIRRLMIGSPATPERADVDLHGPAKERFRHPGGATITTGSPLLKSALVFLSQRWPAWSPFDEALDGARRQSGSDKPFEQDARRLATSLLRCFLGNMIELRSTPPGFVPEVSDRPEASPLARLQAGRQEWVTSLRHETVRLGEPQRRLLTLLDGSLDRDALIREMGESLASAVKQEASAPTQAMNEVLGAFARAALLRA